MTRIDYKLLATQAPEGVIDLPHLVPGEGPVEVEIGFGRGMFLVERAQFAPGIRIFGVEIKSKLAYHVQQRIARLGLQNAVAYFGDAKAILKRLGPASTVSRVYFHFPDPWWKARHEKRTVLVKEVLDEVSRLLRENGELFIQTDVESRAQDFVERIEKSGAYELASNREANAQDYGARSNREKRALEDGIPIYRILARKRSEPLL